MCGDADDSGDECGRARSIEVSTWTVLAVLASPVVATVALGVDKLAVLPTRG